MLKVLNFGLITRWRLSFFEKLNMCHYIEENAKVNDFIIQSKLWAINPFVNMLKIKVITISLFYLKDRIRWKFTQHGEFLVKNSNLGK